MANILRQFYLNPGDERLCCQDGELERRQLESRLPVVHQLAHLLHLASLLLGRQHLALAQPGDLFLPVQVEQATPWVT